MTRSNNTARIHREGITHVYTDIPLKKYENWKTMRRFECDTETFQAPGMPFWLQIEVTSFCNLSCKLCPSSNDREALGRDRRHLKFDEFKAIIDDLEDYLLYLTLWDWGEPFLNPELLEMIRYTASKNIKTVTSTNGHFLTDDSFIKELLNSGLTVLIIALDSLRQEHYDTYRVGGKVDRVIEGSRKVASLKKQIDSGTLINIRMLLSNATEGDVEEVRGFAREIGADVFSAKSLNPMLYFALEDDSDLVPGKAKYRRHVYDKGSDKRVRSKKMPICWSLWRLPVIHSNGIVVPCYRDCAEVLPVGNVFEEPLSQLWNGTRYIQARRRQFLEGKTISICENCEVNFPYSGGGYFPIVERFDLGFFGNTWQKMSRNQPILGRVGSVLGDLGRYLKSGRQ